MWTCRDGYIQLNIFYNCRALRLNLHNNVYGISFILPGECIYLNFELIMSTASQRELAGENINLCQVGCFFVVVVVFNDFRKTIINAL